MKKFLPALFLLWTGAIIVVYYVVQKPGLLNIFAGLFDTLWTFLVAAILLFNAYGLGRRVMSVLGLDTSERVDYLLLGWGLGLGVQGLLGLLFSAIQLAHGSILSLFQVGLAIFFILRNDLKHLVLGLRSLASDVNLSISQYTAFTKLLLLLTLTFSFLLTLVPPFEAFDALSYHLAQPTRVLLDGGLRAVDVPAYWYPNLTENVYLWALAFNSERAAQMVHFAWAVLSIALLWRWAVKIGGIEIGRKTLLLIVSLASLPMVSSWAYADMALVYYAIAALFAVSSFEQIKMKSWLYTTAIMAGLAMSVKYTSFIVPVTCGILLLKHLSWKSVKVAFQFSVLALLIAFPWYLRNLIIMHNPFYPFVFNGLYWDSFRAEWYANGHTGIGWNLPQILMIPLNMILGLHELSPVDGRIGPLFLILLPAALWIFWHNPRRQLIDNQSLRNIGLFVALSFAAWVVGVIDSAGLWQVRFFYPALILFAIPTAIGWHSLSELDRPRLRISSLINIIVMTVVTLTVIDNAIFVMQRNPISYAFGIQNRARYIERVNPSYAALIQIMGKLPDNSKVYSLFEPRSYGLPRDTQPDLGLYNFGDDLFIFKTPNSIIEHWKTAGYTHVIVYERGLGFMNEFAQFTPATSQALTETLSNLKLIGQTPDKVYSVYQIP